MSKTIRNAVIHLGHGKTGSSFLQVCFAKNLKLLRENGYKHLKCICFNPKDKVNINGFNIRQKSPYFLINIASKSILAKTHKNILKTKYFDNMNEEYLNYLHIKKEKK